MFPLARTPFLSVTRPSRFRRRGPRPTSIRNQLCTSYLRKRHVVFHVSRHVAKAPSSVPEFPRIVARR